MEKNKAMLAGNRAYQLFLAVIAPLTVLLIWALGSNLGLIRASLSLIHISEPTRP